MNEYLFSFFSSFGSLELFFVIIIIFLKTQNHLDSNLVIEEFVAHSQSVNCLKIGRKSSRVLLTGGEDHKVNLWAIGKPNAILVSSVSCTYYLGFFIF